MNSNKYLLQKYEDNSYGYLNIDGDEHQNYKTEAKVILQQNEDEEREEFISKNNIEFQSNQYGSNLELDKQCNDTWYVRKEVAEQGYGLDKLINDEHEYVRTAVAEQGYGLDELVTDTAWRVRQAVAEQGYGLDELVTDKEESVRAAVAKHGYGLDILIKDKTGYVRSAVAEQGYGLAELIKDDNPTVRAAVAKHGYGLDSLYKDKSYNVRQAVASQGYRLDILIKDKVWNVKNEAEQQAYETDNIEALCILAQMKVNVDKKLFNYLEETKNKELIDALAHNDNKKVRKELAMRGYGLNILVTDKEPEVRKEVALQGYGLEKLTYDANYGVYTTAVKKLIELDDKETIEKLVDIDNSVVKELIAKAGYCLDILIKENDPNIIAAIASTGNYIDIIAEKALKNNDTVLLNGLAEGGYRIDDFMKNILPADHNTYKAINTYVMSDKVDDEYRKNFLDKYIDKILKTRYSYPFESLCLFALDNNLYVHEIYKSDYKSILEEKIYEELEKNGYIS